MAQRPSIEDFSKVVEACLAAGLNPALWQNAIESIALASAGVRTHVFGHDARTGQILSSSCSLFDTDSLDSYLNYYAAINPKVPAISQMPIGTVRHSSEIFPDDARLKSPYYWEWEWPQGNLSAGAGVRLFGDDNRFVFIGGLIRERDRNNLEIEWIRFLKLLTPHLQHAIEINRMLDGRCLERMAEVYGQDTAVFVLGSDGKALFTNHRAEVMLFDGRVIRKDQRGRVRLANLRSSPLSEIYQRLRTDTHAMSYNMRFVGTDGLSWEVRTAMFDPRNLTLSPFGTLGGIISRCIVFIMTPSAGPISFIRQMRSSFNLTEAEAIVASQLFDGLDLAEIAERRKTSVHTVRNQLKSVMSKTETRRQSELVSLISRLKSQRSLTKHT